MKNKKYVCKTALAAVLGSVIAGSAVMIAPSVGVNAAALTNGPLHYSIGAGQTTKSFNIDGSSVTLPSFLTSAPFYSADGTKVAWVKITMGGSTSSEVFIANADGTDQKKILTAAVALDKPQFSQDKSKIFLSDGSANKIYSFNTTTENQSLGTAIVSDSMGVADYSVSSTNKIGHIKSDSGSCAVTFVVVRDLDGTNPGPITSTCQGSWRSRSLQWNADGTRLFVGQTDQTNSANHRIVAMDPDGGNLSVITTTSVGVAKMALSPDGSKLAFSTIVYSTPLQHELKVINTDGSGVNTVVSNSDAVRGLSWGVPVSSSGSNSSSNTGSATNNNSSSTNTTPATAVVPGVTVTDTKIYTQAPAKVASSSAVSVLTEDQIKTQRIVSNTPSVCVPTKDDIVFIDEGRCSASILSKKSGKVLRQFRTTVVEDEVTELKVGNEVSIVAPIYFDAESTDVNSRGMRRIRGLASQINAAGEVLVVGHSGIALGDTPENRRLSRDRAISTVKAIKKVGAAGPFTVIGVGSKSPAVTSTKGKDQAKNRRTVIILVP